jgi:uncharacterized protein
MRFRCSLLIALAVLLCASVALGASIPERPTRYVMDMAGVVEDGAERKINGFLQELEQKTTAQVVVLTVDSLDEVPLEDFSLQVAEQWGLGRRGQDNGLLIVFAMKERKYRFEVGYGLEGILPDSSVGTIGRQYIVPYFRQGDYSSGVAAAALAAANVIADNSGVEITGMPRLRRTSGGAGRAERGRGGIGSTILTVLFLLGFLYMLIRHPRLLLMMVLFSGMGRRGGWSSGGGFGGGGGGFGGGGGGFGGGGASGGW